MRLNGASGERQRRAPIYWRDGAQIAVLLARVVKRDRCARQPSKSLQGPRQSFSSPGLLTKREMSMPRGGRGVVGIESSFEKLRSPAHHGSTMGKCARNVVIGPQASSGDIDSRNSMHPATLDRDLKLTSRTFQSPTNISVHKTSASKISDHVCALHHLLFFMPRPCSLDSAKRPREVISTVH